MESANIAALWPILTVMTTLLVAAVCATCWIVGRLNGKVDWKVYQQKQDAFGEAISSLKAGMSTLLERSESQGKFIEYFMKNKFTSQTGGHK